MANRTVSIWKYVKVGDRWKYCRPVIGTNNTIKPHFVHVNSHVEEHREGNYYIHFLDGSRQIWKKVGPKPTDARDAAQFQEAVFNARVMGIPLKDPDRPSLSVGGTLYGYLEDYKLSQSAESYALMYQTLHEFLELTNKSDIAQITRADMLRYKQWLINRGRAVRTAGNKMMRVNQYLRAVQGLEPGKGLVTMKDAKFVELEPEVYTSDDLTTFFKACEPFFHRVFSTLLMSGLRKQEMENLEWTDLNLDAGTLSVRAKKNFRPKDWEERTIEIPQKLVEILKAAPRNGKYVFGTKHGNRYTHVWDDCKEIAKKAKLNEEDFHPHKFRASYATRLLQSGVDLKTVQKLLGHKNLESTMRYLAKAQSGVVKKQMDAVWTTAGA